jgi:hypothetical protein
MLLPFFASPLGLFESDIEEMNIVKMASNATVVPNTSTYVSADFATGTIVFTKGAGLEPQLTNNRIVVKEAGTYCVIAQWLLNPQAAATDMVAVVQVNNVSVESFGSAQKPGSSGAQNPVWTTVLDLEVDDSVSFKALQNGGSGTMFCVAILAGPLDRAV